MRRYLVAALALLLLAGCASPASHPPAAKPAPDTTSHSVFARPSAPFSPVATISAGHAHRVHIRHLPSVSSRGHSVNCTGSRPAHRTARVTPSPTNSRVRICLPVGGTLTVTAPDTAYRWSLPRVTVLAGRAGVLQLTGRSPLGTPASYHAGCHGVAQLSATGSPPAGALAAVFLWTARVVVR